MKFSSEGITESEVTDALHIELKPDIKLVTNLVEQWNKEWFQHVTVLSITYDSNFFAPSQLDAKVWSLLTTMKPGTMLEDVLFRFKNEPKYIGTKAIPFMLKWMHSIGAQKRLTVHEIVFGYLFAKPDECLKYQNVWPKATTIPNYVVYSRDTESG